MNTLAFDLGASGGKLIAGNFDGNQLRIQEIHRFQNQPVELEGHLCWNVQRIFSNLMAGLRKSAGEDFVSLGIDSFCNDYGLLDQKGDLTSKVFMYRDHRTEGVLDLIDRQIKPDELFRRTGCQRARFNTLVQLVAQARSPEHRLLNTAKKLLFVPDLLNYFLCGEQSTEFTIASVSQMYNRAGKGWDSEILRAFELPERILPEVVPSAVRIGNIKEEILEKTGMESFSICTVGQHDTASAVAAVPSVEASFAYISSGTWSLVGTETSQMVTSDLAFQENFANEGGVCGKNRLSRNVMGLWLIQEYQSQLESLGENRTFEEMDKEAEQTAPFLSVINPDDQRFFEPGGIVNKIQAMCTDTHQAVPQTTGEITRCIQESLAMAYRETLEKLETLTGQKYPLIHIIGGGAKSELLNGMAASAMKRPVLAGPFEATAIGNLCTQLIAAGELRDLNDIRRIVGASFPVCEFVPQDASAWDAAYERFLKIKYRDSAG